MKVTSHSYRACVEFYLNQSLNTNLSVHTDILRCGRCPVIVVIADVPIKRPGNVHQPFQFTRIYDILLMSEAM